MDLTAMMTPASQILVVILFVLTMMLRSSKNIPNWIIQWIILAVALVLSYVQSNAININTIMNAFIATGICTFGENAIFRKNSEKTREECNILQIANGYKEELSSRNEYEDIDISSCLLDMSEDDIKNIVCKIVEEKSNKSN
ncbi:hypothetical protein CHF27_011470 [Romboutsia maritimum]|uniref:Holin n=1 Tax=Romboutsia maritimum TaxID=2020948 RepID=A0A371IQM6_9FIRM|nr:phage holin family protein [Romboutsia maritimum]RDY22790.1 hypothetical protein CHF27_011470 [Romboutsia maritimum]